MSAARTRSPRSSASPAAAACNMCSNAWVSDRRLGLVHAPLQHRLKLGVAKFLDRFPWRGVRGADPVIHKGFAHILGGLRAPRRAAVGIDATSSTAPA